MMLLVSVTLTYSPVLLQRALSKLWGTCASAITSPTPVVSITTAAFICRFSFFICGLPTHPVAFLFTPQ